MDLDNDVTVHFQVTDLAVSVILRDFPSLNSTLVLILRDFPSLNSTLVLILRDFPSINSTLVLILRDFPRINSTLVLILRDFPSLNSTLVLPILNKTIHGVQYSGGNFHIIFDWLFSNEMSPCLIQSSRDGMYNEVVR